MNRQGIGKLAFSIKEREVIQETGGKIVDKK
jgi:hypothetical protein